MILQSGSGIISSYFSNSFIHGLNCRRICDWTSKSPHNSFNTFQKPSSYFPFPFALKKTNFRHLNKITFPPNKNAKLFSFQLSKCSKLKSKVSIVNTEPARGKKKARFGPVSSPPMGLDRIFRHVFGPVSSPPMYVHRRGGNATKNVLFFPPELFQCLQLTILYRVFGNC